jgi:hypothetical protein
MKADANAAADFLRWVAPEGPWNLVAIHIEPKTAIIAETFTADRVKEMNAWIRSMNNGQNNIYWTVNELLTALNRKPSRADIGRMRFLHVDIDPVEGQHLEAEQDRIQRMLGTYDPPPSCIIFSGGGYQAFWRLREPMPIGGDEALYREAARYNRQLELNFRADACHNVDRIMRLPGTINWPNATKRAKGRKPALAKVIRTTEAIYDLDEFTQAPDVQMSGPNRSTDQDDFDENLPKVDLNDIEETIGENCREVIQQGMDPGNPGRWGGDRSKAVFWLACELVRKEVDRNMVLSILLDRDFAISAHVHDQTNPMEYAKRQIRRAQDHVISPLLRELNDEFAVVLLGGKTRILREFQEAGEDHVRFDLMTESDFGTWLRNRFHERTDDDGKVVKTPASLWWLMHERRRDYKGMRFMPGKQVPGMYNMWTGFAVNPTPGDGHESFLAHIRDNICDGNQELIDYLLGWMAHAVQKPNEPGHTAVVFRGKQGTGKGFFAHHFGYLFGRHYLPVRDSAHIFGQFNGHLEDCVVLFADESFWVDSTKQKSMLKSLITEAEFMVERKGQDARRSRNCVHLIMASNEKWVVPLEGADRRFFVLDVGESHMQDSSYFGRIAADLEGGGYSSLLHYLLKYDLSKFNVRQIPMTDARREQKRLTMTGEREWWYQKLSNGRVFQYRDGWPEYVFATELVQDFAETLQLFRSSERSTTTRLGIFLGNVIPELEGKKRKQKLFGRHRVRQKGGNWEEVQDPIVYNLPDLETCRQHWESEFGPETWDTMGYADVEHHEHIDTDEGVI